MDEGSTSEQASQRFNPMTRDQLIERRRSTWDHIKPHHVVTGEITEIEFAIDNPYLVEWLIENKDNRGRFRKVADELLDKYERGYRMEHLGELMVWLVNGPTEG